MATGYYNNSIFIIGGYNNHHQATEWSITDRSFSPFEDNNNNNQVYGWGQFWTQQDEFLYVIEPLSSPSQFGAFNMMTKQYTSFWKNITMNRDVGEEGCLASSKLYLFVIGGEYFHNEIQMLSLSTYQWVQNVSNMKDERRRHACLVHSDILWVFGGLGTDGSNWLSSNERIDIKEITQTAWNYTQPLTQSVRGLRAVSWGYDIYIIGAATDTASRWIVHVFNTITEMMTVSMDSLLYPIGNAATISVSAVIYVFGGRTINGSVTDKWMYYEININRTGTTNPSPALTQFPSFAYMRTTNTNEMINNQTKSPTSYPTQSIEWKGTIINITLNVDDETSIKEVMYTLNNSMMTYLRDKDISGPLDTEVIERGTVLIVVYELHQRLDTTEINSKEIEREVLNDLEDKNVQIIRIRVDNTYTENVPKDSENDVNIWHIVGIIVLVCLLSTVSVFLFRFYKEHKACTVDMETTPHKDVDKKELNINATDYKQNVVIDDDTNKGERNDAILAENEGETKRVQLVDILNDASNTNTPSINKREHNNVLEVQCWLENVVQLPEYFDIFINNGYESMETIKEISSVKALSEIGIEHKHIQMKILEDIEIWKYEHIVAENRKREGSYRNDRLQKEKKIKPENELVTKDNDEVNAITKCDMETTSKEEQCDEFIGGEINALEHTMHTNLDQDDK